VAGGTVGAGPWMLAAGAPGFRLAVSLPVSAKSTNTETGKAGGSA